MKKSFFSILLVLGITVCLFKTDVLAKNIPVYLDNQKTEISNDVFIEDGRVMVPLRAICEALGYDVNWDDESRGISIGRTGSISYLKLWIDSFEVRNWGEEKLDVAPKIIDGRTYVSLKTLAENLGASIKWDETSKSVHMKRNYFGIEPYNVNYGRFSLFVPQIPYPVDGEIKINEYLKNKLTTELDFFMDKNIDALGGLTGTFEYDIKNNQNNILSIFERRDMHVGAMGLSQFKTDHYSCDTFYKDTGERLNIEDILKGSKEDIEKIIISAYEKYDGKIVSADGGCYGYERCDNNHLLSNYDFYIEDNDLVFVIDVPPAYLPSKIWIARFRINIPDNANLFQEDFLKNFNN